MARDAGTTPEGYDGQLATTHMYYNAADASALAKSAERTTVVVEQLVAKMRGGH